MRMLLEMRYRRTGQFIYTKDEICSIFQTGNVEQLLARSPYLVNIQFELIVFLGSKIPSGAIEQVALSLRKDQQCYISFEDALSRWHVISQIPMMLILATTGESGLYSTPFGRIEFVHVDHTDKQILENTVEFKYSLRLAKRWWAYEDLKCIDRCMDLIDYAKLYTDD
ncbi:Conserved hypothetical protein [Vibrio nigripulchritudo SFn27]|uniref:Uncharacterized protein n=1 Tax=Vibrio nigripulchritudo TaxID=28173 RepID=U4KEM0_9VIBR|nr:hypothetical protein [Vibrio nigripulchritudo]CCN83291.1 Conserved hypothetical protein [Vibrio nigripulchritudo BLFn1]CCN86801.1 Conserved hypothetical protein [Vibrio nigripulchritudo SFn27]CCN95382.1 Conserved hypothetical protein [Vibrio nigripulchritudo ENn2]CCO41539.1 Conserved hypothetical protein [Vibrio nigripulchritudo SFn135]CCO53514.1 Conserved hypothetical protein [Vibrio nigripulchritudo Wn13]